MAGLAELDDCQLIERLNGLTLSRLSSGGLNDGKGIELFFEDASSSFTSIGQTTPTGAALADAAANPGGLLLDVSSPNATTSDGCLSSSPDTDRVQDAAGPETDNTAKAQICFDFTKGMCTRGDKCKYSHDIATIVHFNSKEKGICFDYLRNQCHRGLLCRFSHDLSNIAQQCQAYNGTPTSRGSRTTSICYDFVKGVCSRGTECRYSHDLSLIARTARSSSSSGGATEVCYDFLRGRCSRAANCKYSHSVALLGSGILTTLPQGSLGAVNGTLGLHVGSMGSNAMGPPPMHALSAPVTPRVSSSGSAASVAQHMVHMGSAAAMGGAFPAAVCGSAPTHGYGMSTANSMAEVFSAAAADRLAMVAAMPLHQPQQQQQQGMAAASNGRQPQGVEFTQQAPGGYAAAAAAQRGLQVPPPPPPPPPPGQQAPASGQLLNGQLLNGQLPGSKPMAAHTRSGAPMGAQQLPGGAPFGAAPLQALQQSAAMSHLNGFMGVDAAVRRASDDRCACRDQPPHFIAAANGGIHSMHCRPGPSPLPPAQPQGASQPPTPSGMRPTPFNGMQLYIRTTATPTPASDPLSPQALCHPQMPGSNGCSPAAPQAYSPGPSSAPHQQAHMHQQQQACTPPPQPRQHKQQGSQLPRALSAPAGATASPAHRAQASMAQGPMLHPNHRQGGRSHQHAQLGQQRLPVAESPSHEQLQAAVAMASAGLPAPVLPPGVLVVSPRLLAVPEASEGAQGAGIGMQQLQTAAQPIPVGASSGMAPTAGNYPAGGAPGVASQPYACSPQVAAGDGFLGLGDSTDCGSKGSGILSPNLLPLLKEIWNR